LVKAQPWFCDAAMMSGLRSISKSSLTNRLERFRKLLPPSNRACSQFSHLQNASGKAFAAAVPRNVMIMSFPIPNLFTAG
jgi:hypothetical protein